MIVDGCIVSLGERFENAETERKRPEDVYLGSTFNFGDSIS